LIEAPAHNRFKLPWFALCAVAGVVFLATGSYMPGAIVLLSSVIAIGVILSGRNPWWLRSPLDRRKRSD
jgi:hypothetical protein